MFPAYKEHQLTPEEVTMLRFVHSGVTIVLTVLSWVLVLLLAFFYFRSLTQGNLWLD